MESNEASLESSAIFEGPRNTMLAEFANLEQSWNNKQTQYNQTLAEKTQQISQLETDCASWEEKYLRLVEENGKLLNEIRTIKENREIIMSCLEHEKNSSTVNVQTGAGVIKELNREPSSSEMYRKLEGIEKTTTALAYHFNIANPLEVQQTQEDAGSEWNRGDVVNDSGLEMSNRFNDNEDSNDGSDTVPVPRWNNSVRSEIEISSPAVPSPSGKEVKGGVVAVGQQSQAWALSSFLPGNKPTSLLALSNHDNFPSSHESSISIQRAGINLPWTSRNTKRSSQEEGQNITFSKQHSLQLMKSPDDFPPSVNNSQSSLSKVSKARKEKSSAKRRCKTAPGTEPVLEKSIFSPDPEVSPSEINGSPVDPKISISLDSDDAT